MHDKPRCKWVSDNLLYINYHDYEWGVPIFDDQLLFEFLNLEGMQAGLSWLTVLKKRERFRHCFDNFNPDLIVHYQEARIQQLLADPGIIRNKLKINAVIQNAKAYLKVKAEFGQFSTYIWQFVEGNPIKNHWRSAAEVPTKTRISDALSKDLKKRDFKFIGTTICYAFMQAVGMVNDHTVNCFRYKELG